MVSTAARRHAGQRCVPRFDDQSEGVRSVWARIANNVINGGPKKG